jgi:MoxR-like ATPase
MQPIPGSVEELTSALGEHAYLADRGLSTAIYLSLSLGKPLLLEARPGSGRPRSPRCSRSCSTVS